MDECGLLRPQTMVKPPKLLSWREESPRNPSFFPQSRSLFCERSNLRRSFLYHRRELHDDDEDDSPSAAPPAAVCLAEKSAVHRVVEMTFWGPHGRDPKSFRRKHAGIDPRSCSVFVLLSFFSTDPWIALVAAVQVVSIVPGVPVGGTLKAIVSSSHDFVAWGGSTPGRIV